MGFALSESVYWVGRQSPRVADLGTDGSVGGAKAEGHISERIHRYTAHPAPGRVRLVGAFLKDRYRPARHAAELEPADAGHVVRLDGIISHQRFVSIEESPIGQPIHQAIPDGVQSVGR